MKKLLVDNSFIVPSNQRPYSWGIDNWEELWNDLIDTIKEREKQQTNSFYRYHFFGPMFFIDKGKDKPLNILDGQQRLATIDILLTVIFDLLDLIREKAHISTEGAKVLGKIDECLFETKEGQNCVKVILGKENNKLFENLLKLRRGPSTNVAVHPIIKLDFLKKDSRTKKSNKSIWECYKYFINTITLHIAKSQNIPIENERNISPDTLNNIVINEKGERLLCKLYDSIIDGLYLLLIIVPNSDIAYEIFETLNQRGVKLFIENLFKNLIFERFEKDLGKRLESYWEELVQIGGDELDEFLRHFWLSNFEFVRMKKLFRSVRIYIDEEIVTSENFENFIQTMINEAKIYFALKESTDELWINHDDISQIIDEMSYLGFKQGLPLLLSAYIKYFETNKSKFKELMKSYLNLCVRSYTILGGNPNEFEEKYSELARQIRNDEINIEETIDFIKNNTPSDDKFKSGFIELKISSKIARYILSKVNDSLVSTPLNCVWKNRPTLEHVMPKKPDKSWLHYLNSRNMKHEDFIGRLGNMTILSFSENKELGTLDYTTKRQKYLDMNLPINEKTFRQFTEFNSEAIKKREKILADIAIENTIWS